MRLLQLVLAQVQTSHCRSVRNVNRWLDNRLVWAVLFKSTSSRKLDFWEDIKMRVAIRSRLEQFKRYKTKAEELDFRT